MDSQMENIFDVVGEKTFKIQTQSIDDGNYPWKTEQKSAY